MAELRYVEIDKFHNSTKLELINYSLEGVRDARVNPQAIGGLVAAASQVRPSLTFC